MDLQVNNKKRVYLDIVEINDLDSENYGYKIWVYQTGLSNPNKLYSFGEGENNKKLVYDELEDYQNEKNIKVEPKGKLYDMIIKKFKHCQSNLIIYFFLQRKNERIKNYQKALANSNYKNVNICYISDLEVPKDLNFNEHINPYNLYLIKEKIKNELGKKFKSDKEHENGNFLFEQLDTAMNIAKNSKHYLYVLGDKNSGKSTFINNILEKKILPYSKITETRNSYKISKLNSNEDSDYKGKITFNNKERNLEIFIYDNWTDTEESERNTESKDLLKKIHNKYNLSLFDENKINGQEDYVKIIYKILKYFNSNTSLINNLKNKIIPENKIDRIDNVKIELKDFSKNGFDDLIIIDNPGFENDFSLHSSIEIIKSVNECSKENCIFLYFMESKKVNIKKNVDKCFSNFFYKFFKMSGIKINIVLTKNDMDKNRNENKAKIENKLKKEKDKELLNKVFSISYKNSDLSDLIRFIQDNKNVEHKSSLDNLRFFIKKFDPKIDKNIDNKVLEEEVNNVEYMMKDLSKMKDKVIKDVVIKANKLDNKNSEIAKIIRFNCFLILLNNKLRNKSNNDYITNVDFNSFKSQTNVDNYGEEILKQIRLYNNCQFSKEIYGDITGLMRKLESLKC